MKLSPHAGRYLLLVAVLFSGIYGLQILVDIARPRVTFDRPVVGILSPAWPDSMRIVFWAVLGSWLLVALVLGVLAVLSRLRHGQPPLSPNVRQLIVAVILLLPFTLGTVDTVTAAPMVLLICLPSTAFGLWAVRRFQRYRKLPAGLLLAVFGWGALIAVGFGGANNLWVLAYGGQYVMGLGGVTDVMQIQQFVDTWGFASAGTFEELGKGAGVALAYLVFRRHIDDVVSGVVLGSAAGLGFNLVESVEYIAAESGPFQYWIRQSVGLLAAHVAFTALIGAAFGVARQLHSAGDRARIIAAAYLGAAGGHFASNVLLAWWGQAQPRAFTVHPAVQQLLVQPLTMAVLQGPLVVAYLLVLRHGLRAQNAGLRAALEAEAGTGAGAVLPAEVPILLSPGRRLRLQLGMLRRHGYPAVRALARLQDAQYDLGTRRWHEERGDEPAGPPAEELRRRVRTARLELAHRLFATRAEVPA